MLNYPDFIATLAENTSEIGISSEKLMKVTCHVRTISYQTIPGQR